MVLCQDSPARLIQFLKLRKGDFNYSIYFSFFKKETLMDNVKCTNINTLLDILVIIVKGRIKRLNAVYFDFNTLKITLYMKDIIL